MAGKNNPPPELQPPAQVSENSVIASSSSGQPSSTKTPNVSSDQQQSGDDLKSYAQHPAPIATTSSSADQASSSDQAHTATSTDPSSNSQGRPQTPNAGDKSQQNPPAGDEDDDMPPGRRLNTPKRCEADLSNVLTPAEKAGLITLVNAITENMQREIVRVFDSTGITDSGTATRTTFWSKLPTKLQDLSLTTKPASGAARNGVGSSKEPAANGAKGNDDAADVPEKLLMEHDDNFGPRMAELKKESLAYFRRWQTGLQKRLSDIAVKNAAPATQGSQPSGSRQNGSGSGRGGNRNMQNNRTTAVQADAKLMQLYPPTPTQLASTPYDKRCVLLHCMLLLVLSLEHYSAYSRVLLLNLASSLHVPLRTLSEDEVQVARVLADTAKKELMNGDAANRKQQEENRNSRRWKIGVASAVGAAIIGVTGGLAAPLVAAGLGTVLGGVGLGGTAAAGLLGAMAESSVVVGTLFGLYGARAGGKMMDEYAKDMQDFAFLPLHGKYRDEYHDGKDIDAEDTRLRIVLGVSGWLTQKEDIVKPWRVLGHQSEVYALRFETEALLKMGNALESVVKSATWSYAKKEIIARTSERSSKTPAKVQHANRFGPVFATLMQAMWPLGLLKISKIVDNPWSVGMVRADKAGAVLAEALMSRIQGERGITLIGYSIGARVVFSCLMCLAEKRAFGIVENAVLMGTPAPADALDWCALKSVVAGRLVNVYSENDYILGFLYRTSSIQYGVAGLQRIQGVDGVESVDVTAKVSGHLRYQYLVGSILKHINWEDVDFKQVAEDEETLALVEEETRERDKQREENGLDMDEAKLQQEVEEKNDPANLAKKMGKSGRNRNKNKNKA